MSSAAASTFDLVLADETSSLLFFSFNSRLDFSYLDAFAGIVTVSVGHCHPRVLKAIQDQQVKKEKKGFSLVAKNIFFLCSSRKR